MPVYEVTDLVKHYPQQTTPANDGLTFTVEAGEIFGLLGANGAGKTTLVKQLANLLMPSSGTIRLFGQPLSHTQLYTPGKIGYMPQKGEALNTLAVGETLYFTAHLRGFSRHDAASERDRRLEQFGLGGLRDRPVNRLSGGQKRLVLLATTLTASPPVIILDEPTNDLDPEYRRLVWDEVRALNRDQGTTVILVTHNVVEAERVIQRVGIMRAGKLIAIGRPGQLKQTLNRQLHLEVVFSPTAPPLLPNGASPREVAPGRWQLLIERDEATAYLQAINQHGAVEDFHLSTATLEDLYLALNTSAE